MNIADVFVWLLLYSEDEDDDGGEAVDVDTRESDVDELCTVTSVVVTAAAMVVEEGLSGSTFRGKPRHLTMI
jgi:hypothetical protein